VPKKASISDLSDEELRWLLIERRRASRQSRLDRYRRTGRVVMVLPEVDGAPSWRTGAISDDESAGPGSRSRLRRFLDLALLIVEIGAVIGFFFVLFNGLSVIRDLNREVAEVIEQPTLTPTPAIVAVVLPSGHTPPDSPGGARFNEGEIPAHLQPMIQSLVDISAPTPGPGQATRIRLPRIQVDAPVVQGDGWEQLKKGVGQNLSVGLVNPGEEGNLILSAHNDIFGEIFRDLDRLNPGDEVILYTSQRAYTYLVTNTQIVEPTQVDVMGPAEQPVVTLISCYPYLKDNKRIVVTARLASDG
jgi:sortase A